MIESKAVVRELERLMYNKKSVIVPHIKIYIHQETEEFNHRTTQYSLYPELVYVGYDKKRKILIVQYAMRVRISTYIINQKAEEVDKGEKTLETLKRIVCFLDFHNMNHVDKEEREKQVMTERRSPPDHLTQVRGDFVLGHLVLAEKRNGK